MKFLFDVNPRNCLAVQTTGRSVHGSYLLGPERRGDDKPGRIYLMSPEDKQWALVGMCFEPVLKPVLV